MMLILSYLIFNLKTNPNGLFLKKSLKFKDEKKKIYCMRNLENLPFQSKSHILKKVKDQNSAVTSMEN